ncbi:MAG: four-carbon acid sugar kinase family protein [Trueperella sp.]|nr:four-carbon acid sugar kinase family protein [Trueperella sp.]
MEKSLAELVAEFPPPVPISAAAVRRARATAGDDIVYVVIDDDPTGTQSVSDLPLLMTWEKADLVWAFQTGRPAVYVMTNSRSLSAVDAARVNREVARNAYAAAAETGTQIAFVSRSDSTLRGHFPLEPDVLQTEIAAASGQEIAGVVIVPTFANAGRITVGGVHYAGLSARGYVPVGETEYAQDATFGYRSSRLADWVAEKTGGRIPAAAVVTLDLGTLRSDPAGTRQILRSVSGGQMVAVDAVTPTDLRLLALALIDVEASGTRLLYRTGPDFVAARIGQEQRAPLSRAEIAAVRGKHDFAAGGLVVVGSHVALTTRQLEALCQRADIRQFELDVAQVIDPQTAAAHIAEISAQVAQAVRAGTAVLCTSRRLVTGDSGEDSLEIARRVSRAVVQAVQRIMAAVTPKFVLAKGGITSSDVAAYGLQIRRAVVAGPLLPGMVSLWVAQDGVATGIPYAVFPGNVGDAQSLADVVAALS